MADEIAQWLEGLGLGQYAQVFAENDVDFEVLPNLSDDNLKELGFTLGHRVKLQSAIKALSVEETTAQFTGSPGGLPEAHTPKPNAANSR